MPYSGIRATHGYRRLSSRHGVIMTACGRAEEGKNAGGWRRRRRRCWRYISMHGKLFAWPRAHDERYYGRGLAWRPRGGPSRYNISIISLRTICTARAAIDCPYHVAPMTNVEERAYRFGGSEMKRGRHGSHVARQRRRRGWRLADEAAETASAYQTDVMRTGRAK